MTTTPPVHRKGTCQWCDLYRAQGIPLPDHCPEQDIKAADAVLPDPLDAFGLPEAEASA